MLIAVRLTIPQRIFAVTLAAALLSGCETLGYYAHSVSGHARLMAAGRDIDEVLNDQRTPQEIKERLRLAQQIRAFASRELGLPDNGSYRSYVQLDRPNVVWNVFAAGELSLQPEQWCFPVVGCVAYRGYFALDQARAFAGQLRGRGLDVYVTGVRAYSTLGWLDDPLLSTVIMDPDEELAGLIFHELAHQVVYVRDDTTFNESFATLVEMEGARRWLARAGAHAAARPYGERKAHERQVIELLLEYRRRLGEAYAARQPDDWKRAEKARLFAALKADYAALRKTWGEGATGYDAWFAQDLNNAHLVPVGAYYRYVPAFAELLRQSGGDLPAFYARVREIAEMPRAERDALLQGPGALEGTQRAQSRRDAEKR
jgi:predicted aminopeptidase